MLKIIFSILMLFTIPSFAADSNSSIAPTSIPAATPMPNAAPTSVTPPGASSTSPASTNTHSNGFILHTSAFSGQNPIPALYTCDGKDLSPELDWTGVPPKTETLAFILSDPDAPGGTFYHWVLYNIPKTILSIPEGAQQLPEGIMVGNNSAGTTNYKGPCPPKDTSHRYIFTLYALDAPLKLQPGAEAKEVLDAMQNHILDKVELSTIYSH